MRGSQQATTSALPNATTNTAVAFLILRSSKPHQLTRINDTAKPTTNSPHSPLQPTPCIQPPHLYTKYLYRNCVKVPTRRLHARPTCRSLFFHRLTVSPTALQNDRAPPRHYYHRQSQHSLRHHRRPRRRFLLPRHRHHYRQSLCPHRRRRCQP